MKKKQQRIQFVLVSIGFLLIIATYFYFPGIKKDKILKDQTANKEDQKVEGDGESTYFENLEYKGLYDLDKPFSIKSKEAYIFSKEPNIVYMENMHVILYLSGNRIVEITSLKGRYNKENYNCFFDQDVYATDGETVITSNNLDLLATKNIMKIYNNVNLDNPTSSLQADKIDYNFKTKYFKVSMFDDKEIEMQVTQ
jgi:LPS export ABC transporter protein LptC